MSAASERVRALGDGLDAFLPDSLRAIEFNQNTIPNLAKNPERLAQIDRAVRSVPTEHDLRHMDARELDCLADSSVHLVLTSPPYWTLKEYREGDGQLGFIEDYESFMVELDKVWAHCHRALVPGGRLIVVVGDVCLSRRKNKGEHTVVPLHATIQEHCRALGFSNLAPIIWYKIANAQYEVGGGGGFLGKPYEPNAVIKNDIEFILMQRKTGGYRQPSLASRLLSVISATNHRAWFQQIWTGVTGASTRDHPAPFPEELAARLIRMFSFVGDTVLDPFMGTGTTNLAAAKWGRNSIGIEVESHYYEYARTRLERETSDVFGTATSRVHDRAPV
ncbi:MAG: site-specific DNA-methyltransferase [Nitrococcus sp.]|nr:site-specific DNA-methyltransferase [Nitrococcus sp.]